MDKHAFEIYNEARTMLSKQTEDTLDVFEQYNAYWSTRYDGLKRALEEERRKTFELQTELNLIKQQRR